MMNDKHTLNQPLYDGENITLLQALAKYFEWFTAHPGTSKKALSSILPKNNLLPNSYASARKLLDPFLIKTQVYQACPNDCILFRNQYAENITCPKFHANRYRSEKHSVKKFVYLPIGPRLARMFGSKNISRILQNHFESARMCTELMYDIQRSPEWAEAYSPSGVFNGDLRGISLGFCTDDMNPFGHNCVSYSMWPIMLTLLNLPNEMWNSFSNILLLGIVPGNGTHEPQTLDPYIEVMIDELIQISSSAVMYDSYKNEPFKLKAEILLYTSDYPGMGKVIRMSGSGAYKGCMWCEIKGMFAYMHMHVHMHISGVTMYDSIYVCTRTCMYMAMDRVALFTFKLYCSDLHKMIYLENRRYSQLDPSLRLQKKEFASQKPELQPQPLKENLKP